MFKNVGVKLLSTSCESLCCLLILSEALTVPFKQGQDKHAIKGQASCSNDPFRVTDMLRRSKLPHRILSLSHYLSPLSRCLIFQNNGNKNFTETNHLHFLSHHCSLRDTHLLATQLSATRLCVEYIDIWSTSAWKGRQRKHVRDVQKPC